MTGSNTRSATRFATVGVTNVLVSFVVFCLCLHYLPAVVQRNLPQGAVANALAYVAGMVNSFVLNRTWTFQATGNTPARALRFCVVNLSGLAFATAAMYLFVDRLEYPAVAVWVPVTLVVVTLNYVGYKRWAFAPASFAPECPR
jgi:putative flippase GtrA